MNSNQIFKSITVVLLFLFVSNLNAYEDISNLSQSPKSVKLSLTSQVDEMQVSWFTNTEIGDSFVQFSQVKGSLGKIHLLESSSSGGSGAKVANGTSEPFSSDWTGYIHTVLMSNLEPNTVYYYQCGGSLSKVLSKVSQFSTSNFNSNPFTVTPFTAVVYADMGYGGGFNNTVNAIAQNIDNYDIIFHVGDIAYADYDNVEKGNQTVWDDFLDTLEPLTSRLPYMTVPGNHDVFYSFQAYQQTFGMPGSAEAPWYSFDYNGIHFIAISTESDLSPFTQQYQWIREDLMKYRKLNPDGFIIAYAHRPYYCTTQYDWCKKQTLRALIESTVGELFQQFNVDIFMAGHTHAYERSYPVYEQVNVGNYEYPGGTVHLVIGTPGNQQGLELPSNWINPRPTWNAYRYAELGYAQFTVHNSTHIYWEFIRDSDQTVMDSQWFVKGYFD